MACGDQYRYLEVTDSGYTRDNPYGTIPLFTDYEQWKELARTLSVKANERFNELGTVEQEEGNGTYPFWNQLVELNNSMSTKYSALPSTFTLSVPGAIRDAQAVIDDALCLMERSDEGILHYTGTKPAPVRTKMRPWVKWTLIGAGALTAGVLTAVGVKYYRKRRRRNPRRRKNPELKAA